MELSHGISIVIPIYCSEFSIKTLVDEVCANMIGHDFEIILVDDKSKDNSWSRIVEVALANHKVRGMRLGKNFGQHSALLAGIRSARFNTTVTLDDDLQNPPSEIYKLLSALTPEVDVVYGVSSNRKHARWRNASSFFVGKFFTLCLGYEESSKISQFRAFKTQLREGFSLDIGPNVSIDSLLTWSTSSFKQVQVKHESRKFGHSNYSLLKLVKHLLDTATSYSVVPLRLSILLGLAATFFGLILFLWVLIPTLFSNGSVPGFPSLAASLAIFSGTQLLMLGVLGEYIGKIHFRVMNKPTYLIAETTSPTKMI